MADGQATINRFEELLGEIGVVALSLRVQGIGTNRQRLAGRLIEIASEVDDGGLDAD